MVLSSTVYRFADVIGNVIADHFPKGLRVRPHVLRRERTQHPPGASDFALECHYVPFGALARST